MVNKTIEIKSNLIKENEAICIIIFSATFSSKYNRFGYLQKTDCSIVNVFTIYKHPIEYIDGPSDLGASDG